MNLFKTGLAFDTWVAIGLLLCSVSLRIVTYPWYGSSISTDEYRYALIASEWVRLVRGESTLGWNDLIIYHPLVPFLAGVLSLVVPSDQLTIGRGLQLFFNAALAPLGFLLARQVGATRLTAGFSGVALAIMPATWEMSTAFWPDSQNAFLSTLVLIGLIAAMKGNWAAGTALAVIMLYFAFLTKEHMFLLMLPAAGILIASAAREGAIGSRLAVATFAILVIGVLLSLTASIFAPFLPRAAVVWLLVGRPASPVIHDGLPMVAQAMEESGAQSWMSSALFAALTGNFELARLSQGLNVRVWGVGLAAAGLAGVFSEFIRELRSWGGQHSHRSQRSLIDLLFALIRIVSFGAIAGVLLWQILSQATPINLAWSAAALLVGVAGAIRSPAASMPRWVACGLSSYTVGTIAFFLLSHEILSLETRYVLTTFPIFALYMGLGMYEATALITLIARRVPDWILCLLASSVLAVVIPGGPLDKGVVMLLGLITGVVIQLSPRIRGGVTMYMVGSALVAAFIVAATPTLTTVVRARNFKGYPDDPLVRGLAGVARVETFRQAEPWLRDHLKPGDIVISSKPYPVAWHSGLGFAGFQRERVWNEFASDRRRYFSDDLLATGNFDWVIDFNQYAIQSQSPEGPLFVEDYAWLASRPYLKQELVLFNKKNQVVFFAFSHRRT